MLLAHTVAVPSSPEEIIKKANFICVGILKEEAEGVYFFEVRNILKGNKDGAEKRFYFTKESQHYIDLKYYTEKFNAEPTIFIGHKNSKQKLVPEFAQWSFWPQALPANSAFLLDKLEFKEVVRFINGVIATQKSE